MTARLNRGQCSGGINMSMGSKTNSTAPPTQVNPIVIRVIPAGRQASAAATIMTATYRVSRPAACNRRHWISNEVSFSAILVSFCLGNLLRGFFHALFLNTARLKGVIPCDQDDEARDHSVHSDPNWVCFITSRSPKNLLAPSEQ